MQPLRSPRPRRPVTGRRLTGRLAVTGLLSALLVSAGSGSATAGDQQYCALSDVPESAGTPVVLIRLKPHQSTSLVPGGSIWAGVWFTGWNGPAGWTVSAPSGAGYPLPGAREYSLIAAVAGQPWRYVGASATTFTNNSATELPLYAWINDSWHGNGSGSLSATVCYYA